MNYDKKDHQIPAQPERDLTRSLFYVNKEDARSDKDLLTDIFMFYLSTSEPCNKDLISPHNKGQNVYDLYLSLSDVFDGLISKLPNSPR